MIETTELRLYKFLLYLYKRISSTSASDFDELSGQLAILENLVYENTLKPHTKKHRPYLQLIRLQLSKNEENSQLLERLDSLIEEIEQPLASQEDGISTSQVKEKRQIVNQRNSSDKVCGNYYHYPKKSKKRFFEGGLRLKHTQRKWSDVYPVVTIITVVFNNKETVKRCIESVLNQNYPNVEYLIIDGGSTDGTLDVIKSYESIIDYILSEPDSGIYDAMNKGLSLAKGNYIAFLNADDFYLPNAIRYSINNIRTNSLDISYAGFYYTGPQGEIVVVDEARPWDESLLIQGVPGGHETLFAHRDCYNQIGRYDTSYKIVADYDWYIRAFLEGCRAAPLSSTILVMDPGGASFSEDSERAENYELLGKVFGPLSDDWKRFLYDLKYYRNWHGFDMHDHELTERLAETAAKSDLLHKALFLTIDERKLGPRGRIVPARKHSASELEICIALTYLTNASGGAERIAIESANRLAQDGHAVTVVLCHGLAGGPYYDLDPEIPVIDLAAHPYKQEYLAPADKVDVSGETWSGRDYTKLGFKPENQDFDKYAKSHHFWRARMYRGFFSRHKFDLVISHMPSTYPYVLLGRDEDDPTVHLAVLHNAPEFKFYSDLYPSEDSMERYMRLVTLEKADYIGVLFNEFVKQMPEAYRDKCITLPDFASESLVPSDNKRHRKQIISVGRLVPQKDHETLLRAFSKIRKKFPEWSLRIYGDGPLRKSLLATADDLGLDGESILVGARREISLAYEEGSIVALPSVFEGFGLTAVEAMKYGLPVVAFDNCEGVRYLIDDGVDGVLADGSHKVESMADALATLIESKDMRSLLGTGAKRKAAQYSIDAHVSRLYSLIDVHCRVAVNRPCSKSKRLRVAILSTYLHGGAGIAALRLKRGLREQGHDARTVSFSAGEAPHDYQLRLRGEEQAIYGQCKSIGNPKKMEKGGTLFSSSYPSLSFSQLSFLRYFDVINLHWIQTMLSIEAVNYIASLGKPVVWTLHDMNPFTGGCHYSQDCLGYMDTCNKCPQVDPALHDYPASVLKVKKKYWPSEMVVVTPSRWLAGQARVSAVFQDKKIRTIANGLDVDVFKPHDKRGARRKFGVPQDKNILLFMCQSHRERRKGFNALIRLTHILSQRSVDEYHVILFGNESDALEELKLPYTALGHIGEPAELAMGYSAADVTILPTWEDNLPNVILESVACGTPIVAFDSGGVGDAVIPNVTGKLVKRGDYTALAHETETICSEEGWAQHCREYALRWFTQENQAVLYGELFELLTRPLAVASMRRQFSVYPEMEAPLNRLLQRNATVSV